MMSPLASSINVRMKGGKGIEAASSDLARARKWPGGRRCWRWRVVETYVARPRKGDNDEESEKAMDPKGDTTAQRARFIILTVGREGKDTEG